MKVLIPIETLTFEQAMYAVEHSDDLTTLDRIAKLHADKLTRYNTFLLLVDLIQLEKEYRTDLDNDNYRDSIFEKLSGLHKTLQAQVDNINITVINFLDIEISDRYYRYYWAYLNLKDCIDFKKTYDKEHRKS